MQEVEQRMEHLPRTERGSPCSAFNLHQGSAQSWGNLNLPQPLDLLGNGQNNLGRAGGAGDQGPMSGRCFPAQTFGLALGPFG